MSASDFGLVAYIDSQIFTVTSDGRCLVGVLRGFDQLANMIVDDCHERVFSSKGGTYVPTAVKAVSLHPLYARCFQAGVEQVPLPGLHLIRGDNIVLVGELDAEKDQLVDLSTLRAAPLKAVNH